MGVAVELEGVSRRHGPKVVLDQLSLRIAPGEVVALLGPSGCGKTTTLRLVAGLDRPDGGVVRLGDRVVAGPTWVPPERRGLGMVFQSFALWPHRTVRENIAWPLRLRGVADATDRAEAWLGRVRLDGLGDRFPHTLSGGQQQRVAVARALAPRPDALLLDEPFSSLDTGLRAELRALVLELARAEGQTTLLVTHDPEEALEMADRVAVMRAGRLSQVGAPAELYDRPTSAYVARLVGPLSTLAATRRAGRLQVGGVDVGASAGADGPVTLGLRPEWIRWAPVGIPATVTGRFYRGSYVRWRARVGEAEVQLDGDAAAGPALRLERWIELGDDS